MSLAIFEPTIPASEQLQIHASDRASTGIGSLRYMKAQNPRKLVQ